MKELYNKRTRRAIEYVTIMIITLINMKIMMFVYFFHELLNFNDIFCCCSFEELSKNIASEMKWDNLSERQLIVRYIY